MTRPRPPRRRPDGGDRSTALLLEVTTSRARRVRNGLATAWMYGAFVVAVIPLGFIVVYVVPEGPAAGAHAATGSPSDIPAVSRKAGGGMAPAIVGTLAHHRCGATVMAVPLGVLGAIYLHEYGGQGRLATAHPVHGRRHDRRAVDRDGPVHLHDLHAARSGSTGFGGSLALACLMLPIVIRSTEEMLRLVPDELRQASYALGNRKWRTILTVVLPAALRRHRQRRHAGRRPGRRRDGAAAVHHRRGPQAQPRPLPRAQHAPCRCRSSPTPRRRSRRAQDRAWGAAFTLIAIVFVLTVIARIVSARFSLKHS